MKELKECLEHASFEKMEKGARLLIEALGEVTCPTVVGSTIDLNDPNFKRTPYRIAKMYIEMCQGLGQLDEVENILETGFPSDYSGMIVVDKIGANSLCPHHFLPVVYQVNFAYIPKKKMLGLSKIPRFIKLLSKRPVLQEDYTKQLITKFIDHVQPLGAIAVVTGVHNCMVCRGVETTNSAVTTSEVYGVFEQIDTRMEFFEILKQRR